MGNVKKCDCFTYKLSLGYAKAFIAPTYTNTTPALNNSPPNMSDNQCTPEINLPTTIKKVNPIVRRVATTLTECNLIRLQNCTAAVGMTQATSNVVDEG